MDTSEHPGLRALARKQTALYAIRTGLAGELRERAGLSQGDVSRALGTDVGSVCKWESGKRKPTGAAGVAYLELIAGLVETAAP